MLQTLDDLGYTKGIILAFLIGFVVRIIPELLSSWFAILTIVFFIGCLLVLGALKRKFMIKDSLLIIGSIILSAVIVLPLYDWMGVILQNVSRISSSTSSLYLNPNQKDLMLHVLTNFNVSFLSFGYCRLVFH